MCLELAARPSVGQSLIAQLGRNLPLYQFESEVNGRAQRDGASMGEGATPWRETGVRIEHVQHHN